MAIDLEFLKSTPYFSGLTSDELRMTASYVFEKGVPRLDVIEHEGEKSTAVYIVMSGVVKVYKTSEDGKEQILRLVKPGESFSELPFDQTNPVSVQAMGPVILYGITKTDLENMVRSNNKVAVNLVRALSTRVKQLIDLVEDLSFKNVIGRIAKILLETSDAPSPRLTQQEMAAMAGTAREMVGRSLKSLEDNGSIRMDHHRIVIRDKQALVKIAGVNW